MKPDIVNQLHQHEEGALTEQETIRLLQALIKSGQCWLLSGHYGRVAMSLIRDGCCALGLESHVDGCGNLVPARDLIEPGALGSAEAVLKTTGAPPLDGETEA